MTGWKAGGLGAVTCVLTSCLTATLAGCIGEVYRHSEPRRWRATEMFSKFVRNRLYDAGPVVSVVVLVAVSALVGFVLGLVAARLHGRSLRRVLVLSLIALAALWVTFTVDEAARWAAHLRMHGVVVSPAQLLRAPIPAAYIVAIGAWLLLPYAVFTAVLVERLSRPASPSRDSRAEGGDAPYSSR